MAMPAVSSARRRGNAPSIGTTNGKGRVDVAVAIVSLALLALWGWSHWTSGGAVSPELMTVSGTAGVVGGPYSQATGGPAIPVNHPEPLAFRPIVVTGRTSGGASVHLRLKADSHGRFTVKLPAGTYTVTALVSNSVPPTASQRITSGPATPHTSD
jgi:hypothetical protein